MFNSIRYNFRKSLSRRTVLRGAGVTMSLPFLSAMQPSFAETLKVVMRHQDFATTEKHYGAIRSAASASEEIKQCLSTNANSDAFVGGLMGGNKKPPQLDSEEVLKLKALLERL